MRRLKCPDCGGQVRLRTSPEGHILGTCAHCASEFVIEAHGRQHVIVEHRFPDGQPRQLPAGPALSRRAALGVGGAVLAGLAATAFGLTRTPTGGTAGESRAVEVLFNVGGEGAGAGQFRNHVFDIGIDSLGRAALIDNDDRVYVFGPEGQFVTQYMPDAARRGKFCALRPGGDLIFADSRRFDRVALDTGALLESVETKARVRGWNTAYALTAQGGLAVYATEENSPNLEGTRAPEDHITFFSPALRQERRVTALLAQAIAPDPMVRKWPAVTALAIDPAGSLYLNIRAEEDNDLRGGIFEFNAEGKLQRRIEVAQSWLGHLAIGPANRIWYGDAWRSDLQHISQAGRGQLPLSGLAERPNEALGNVAAFALYPGGDIGVVTMNHRFARLRPKLQDI